MNLQSHWQGLNAAKLWLSDMQCQPQFAQLVAAMQQLDKRFLGEKQKVDHLGGDCYVIPTLRELFPKLSIRGIQERCGMIDKYRAYEREMQVIFAYLQFGHFIHYLLLSSVHLVLHPLSAL